MDAQDVQNDLTHVLMSREEVQETVKDLAAQIDRDYAGKDLLIVGITTLMAVQVFLNMAVVLNLLPATGIALPFFSYGGTALWVQLIEMGIILAVSRQIAPPRR